MSANASSDNETYVSSNNETCGLGKYEANLTTTSLFWGTKGKDAEILTAMYTNFWLCMVALALYMFLHRKKKDWYYTNPVKRGFGPPKLSGAWDFVKLMRTISLEEIEQHAGADAYTLLLFLHTVSVISRTFAVKALPLFLIYVVASLWIYPDGLSSEGVPVGELMRANIANLKRADACGWWEITLFYLALVGSVAAQYLLSYTTFTTLESSWLRIVDRRQSRLAEDGGPATQAVLIQGSAVPKHSLELKKLWTSLYGDKLYGIRVVRDAQALPRLMKEAFKQAELIKTLEHKRERLKPKPMSQEELAMTDRQRATRDKQMADNETKLDAAILAHEVARDEATSTVAEVDVPENDTGNSYFVLFRTRAAANTALQVTNSLMLPNVRPCPFPSEVCWDTLYPGEPSKALIARSRTTLFFYLTLFFSFIPISFIGALVALDNLEKNVPPVKWIFDFLGSAIRTQVAAFLPNLALIVFLAQLPNICIKFASARGTADLAQVEVDAILNLWTFYFTVLFGSVAINAALSGGTIEEFSVSMANGVSIHVIYLCIQFQFALPFGVLSRVPTIIVASILRRLNLLAPNVTKPEPLAYNVVWSKTLVAIAMGMIFAVAFPPILLFVNIFLTVSYFLFGRSLLFSNSRGFLAGKEGGKGLMWVAASKWLLMLLFFGQVFLIGLHLAQEHLVTAVLLIPLVFATRYHHVKFDRLYAPQLQLLPMDRCVQCDAKLAEKTEEEREKFLLATFSPDTYVQPELCPATWTRLRERQTAPIPPGTWVPPPPCLRVGVLGASGGTGEQVVRLLIKEGHTVVAFARDVDEIQPSRHRRLKKFALDLWEEDAGDTLTQLLKGCSMVISCLGSRRGEDKIVHRGTAALLPALLAAGVPRMAMMSCVGVGDSGAQLRRMGVVGLIFTAMFATLLSSDKKDLMAAEAECQRISPQSGLACVVVRTADLKHAPPAGQYEVAKSDGIVGASVSREDVASFLVSLVLNTEYDGSTISVGGFVKGKAPAKPATTAAAPQNEPKKSDKKAVPQTGPQDEMESDSDDDIDKKIHDLESQIAKLQAAKEPPSGATGGAAQPPLLLAGPSTSKQQDAPTHKVDATSTDVPAVKVNGRALSHGSDDIRLPIYDWLEKAEQSAEHEDKVALFEVKKATGSKRV